MDTHAAAAMDTPTTTPPTTSTVPVNEVTLDAAVVLRIVAHCRLLHPSSATGQLLGVDVESSLQVASCFPFTPKAGRLADDDAGAAVAAALPSGSDDAASDAHVAMLKALQRLALHANVAGFYQSFPLGDFFNYAFIDNLYNYQKAFPWAVAIVYDPTKTAMGNLGLRALRLTDRFMSIYASDKKFNWSTVEALNFAPSHIFQYIPVHIKTSHLLSSFLAQLEADLVYPVADSFSAALLDTPASTFSNTQLQPTYSLDPNLDTLDLPDESFLEKQLEYISDCIEDYETELRRYNGWQKLLQRETQRLKYRGADIENHPQIQKILSNEPSKLESLLIMNQIQSYAEEVERFAGPALTKMYLVKGVQH